ncbi:hypothetical protein [Halorubrum salinum]|uniref:hypothetical protein n=1 Tax=Halorubrum salinum TaxID=767517 RepID=UPI00211109B0|nr:hypothetical protein [Halorubrum salinum]
MSSRTPNYRTLRLLCANGAGMVGFLSAYALGRDFVLALAAGGVVAAIGYAASSAVVSYAGG